MGNFISSVLSFIGKYANEAEAVSVALNAILDALPIQQQDRERIKAEVAKIEAAPAAIRNWIDNVAPTVTPTAVHIDAADVDRAVGAFLTAHIGTSDDLVNQVVAAMKVQGLVVAVAPAPIPNENGGVNGGA